VSGGEAGGRQAVRWCVVGVVRMQAGVAGRQAARCGRGQAGRQAGSRQGTPRLATGQGHTPATEGESSSSGVVVCGLVGNGLCGQ